MRFLPLILLALCGCAAARPSAPIVIRLHAASPATPDDADYDLHDRPPHFGGDDPWLPLYQV